jgi:peptide/nickel transport system substrate-binding protein
MKRLWVGLIAMLVLGLVVGFGSEAVAAPKGTLTIGIPTDINTLDPQMGPEVNSLNVAFSAMEPLLRLDAQGNIKPRLAESWEVVNNTTYIFKLRKNVKFHNGEPFNGKAVEYSWKRSQEKQRANKEPFAGIARIEHIDDYTIKIVTEKPDPIFLKKMANVSAAIFPPKATADGGDEAASLKPIGTGPYILSSWVKGEHITFKANPNY